jgi:flagellar M-ring protein FliF
MSKIWQQLTAIWGRLEISQRATVVLVMLAFTALAVGLGLAATRPDFRLLARDLTKGQVAEIAAYLESSHVSYQVADRETAILVPSKDLYRLRNELSERDMLGDGSKGFELLAKNSMWDSSFSEHRTYDRAVAGELERSFRELPGVRSARVLIDRPQPSPFVGDQEAKPKASIKLDMQQSSHLSNRQIAGILHLAAGAVVGLTTDHVEIMDGSGLLTPAGADSGAMMAQNTLEAETARDTYLTRKAQEQLDVVLGPGHSSVKVAVKLDFTKRSSATSDPGKSVLLKEDSHTTDEKTPVGGTGGVAGSAPNVEGEGQPAAVAPQLGTKTSEETKNEYVVGKSTTTQEDEVGRIKGMSVSVLLDYKVSRTAKLDDKGQPTKEMVEKREEYSDADKVRFKDLVLNAIGYAAAKGSQSDAPAVVEGRFSATVQSMEMWHEAPEPVAQAAATLPGLPALVAEYGGYLLVGLVALALLVVARGQLKRSHRAWAEAEERARLGRERETGRAKQESGPEGQATSDDTVRERRQELKDQIRKRVLEDPTSAAQIVRRWLYEA